MVHQSLFAVKTPTSLENYRAEDGKNLEEMYNLNTVNIFVGENNSGKSRFLRGLAKEKNLGFFPKLKNFTRDKFVENFNKINDGLKNIVKQHEGIIKFSTPSTGTLSLEDIRFDKHFAQFFFGEVPLEHLRPMVKTLDVLKKGDFKLVASKGQASILAFQKEMMTFLNSVEKELTFFRDMDEVKPITKKKRIYIPILRSLNCFKAYMSDQEVDIFQKRVLEKYFEKDEQPLLDIFTGQLLYRDTKRLLLGSPKERKMIADYEKFLSHSLFNDKEVSLIPKEGDDVLHIKIGLEEKEVYNLGDGIQNLIVLTFPIFTNESALIFIEEPEINLHPGMQRKLIQVIQRNPQHQYFITTHSNHILDLSLDYSDTSIFTFRSNQKNPNEKVVTQVSDGDDQILEILGAQNTSVFLSNSTIWVEGVTDRLYIQKFLDLFLKKYSNKEQITQDIDYSFVEYGGNNVTHWSFLEDTAPTINVKRLCGTMILVADRDDANSKKTRKKLLRKNLGTSRYLELKCREIENILSLKTIEAVLKNYEGETYKLPAFKSKYPHREEPLGTFIEKKLVKGTKKRRGSYATESGTIKDKVAFCQLALKNISHFDDLTDEAKKLTKKLYNFVLSQKVSL